MITFAQFGAGRIGAIHAANLAASGGARLRYVVDVNPAAAQKLAAQHGAQVADVATALGDPGVDAVIIASSTDTHADLAIAAARAGKAIFCEKPVDLSLKRVDACLAAVKKAGVPMLVGFNRRFDPSFAEVHRRIRAGAIGAVEQVIVTSRDPGLPPIAYLKVSGGQFRDMTIHDFDMARWLLGEEPVEVFAYGSCLVDPAVAKAGDTDSVMILMKTASGKLAHINNSGSRCTVPRGASWRATAQAPRLSRPTPPASAPTSRCISSSSATPTPTGSSWRHFSMRSCAGSRCPSVRSTAVRPSCSPRPPPSPCAPAVR
jgi:myo-inositol 2-dehydrogenase/D-chiro-inositol 1-dehydrogenase